MILLLLGLHAVLAASAPGLVALLGRRAFLVLALAPAASLAWLLVHAPDVTGTGAVPLVEVTGWVPDLDLALAFRLDTLAWTVAVLVTGVGALVLAYCASYFRPDDPSVGRFAGVFTAFAGSMLALVLADDLVVLYVCWELTTVLSYLLVGHNPERRANRRAAMTALLVTTFGGLALLVGVVILGEAAGTYRISEVLVSPPGGTAVDVAVLLLLVGAVSKSALVPFHFWLPGAMAAPTPVSAYLHAAAMVKAGVFLVALLAPVYAGSPGWRVLLLVLGSLTMLVGAARALRQYDVKLLLAYGTVSQLGFLVATVGLGTRAGALAGLAMVVAHALFKSTLFLVVGIVDRTTGTRDLRHLSGLGRRLPVVGVVTVLAALSMAGVAPLAGFVAKESVLQAFVDVVAEDGDGTGLPVALGLAVLAALVVGSLLTAAYTARFVWGVLWTKPGVAPTPLTATPRAGFWAPAAVLAAASLAVGFGGPLQTDLLAGYTDAFPEGGHEASLALWHGLTPALGLSLLAVLGGLVVFALRARLARLRWTWPQRLDAERGYQLVMRGVDRLAVEVTGATQRGSLPVYLGVIVTAFVLVPGSAAVLRGDWGGGVRLWESPAQVAVGVVMAGAAVLAVRARQRVRAVIAAGVVGYGTALLFVLHGAPDLGLTQVLVESVTLVVCILVLRRLPTYFTDRPKVPARWYRVGIGVAAGVATSSFVYLAASSRIATPVSEAFAPESVDYGGGRNIVNVTLVDIRAWDTMGELSVLVVAATGVASLIFLITGRTALVRPAEALRTLGDRAEPAPDGGDAGDTDDTGDVHDRAPARPTWLTAGHTLATERRSVLLEITTRLIFHLVLVFSVYLTFSGHNNPGGGFAGGLLAGIALMIRYLAGGRLELDEAAPVDAGAVLGGGLALAVLAGLAPLLLGGEVFQSAILDVSLPVLGDVKLVTSLFLDLGVYLVVVGLMLDVVRSLGGGIDRDAATTSAETRDVVEQVGGRG